MEVVCPRCNEDNAFFNGVTYECPNCDNEWTDEVTDNFYLDEDESGNDEK